MLTPQKNGSEFNINKSNISGSNSEWPQTSSLSDGGYVATWVRWRSGSTDYDIKAQIFAADGAKVGDEFNVNTNTQSRQWNTAVSGLADGGFVVTWQDGDGPYDNEGASLIGSGTLGDVDSSIKAQIFSAGGVKIGSEFLVNTDVAGVQSRPKVVGLTNGNFVVTWMTPTASGSQEIKAQVFKPDGSKVGVEYLVNSEAITAVYPSIAALSTGGFFIAWGDVSVARREQISAQIFNANGTKVGSQISVADVQEYLGNGPAVSGLKNGGFVVTWDNSRNVGINSQIFDENGAKIGNQNTLNENTIYRQGVPSVAQIGEDKILISWMEYNERTGRDRLRAQILNSDGYKIGQNFNISDK